MKASHERARSQLADAQRAARQNESRWAEEQEQLMERIQHLEGAQSTLKQTDSQDRLTFKKVCTYKASCILLKIN